jgi:hypothetical protein
MMWHECAMQARFKGRECGTCALHPSLRVLCHAMEVLKLRLWSASSMLYDARHFMQW